MPEETAAYTHRFATPQGLAQIFPEPALAALKGIGEGQCAEEPQLTLPPHARELEC